MRLANSVAVKQQMDCSFSDSSHRWFSRWILLGSYSLGGNISCWFWQAGQLEQRQYPCFAFPCTCPVLPRTGRAGTVLSATALPSLCTPYVPHSSRLSLAIWETKCLLQVDLPPHFCHPVKWQMLFLEKQNCLQIVMIFISKNSVSLDGISDRV